MKKINTIANIILHGTDGTAILLQGGADDVLDALKAHRDIEHTVLADSENPTMKYVIPFHGVDVAMIFHEAQTVEAPEDAFCDAEQGRLVVKYQEPLPGVYFASSGGVCEAKVPKFTPIITFDGEELSMVDFITNGGTVVVEGATLRNDEYYLPVDCNAQAVTYTTVYTYQGETFSLTVTQGRDIG